MSKPSESGPPIKEEPIKDDPSKKKPIKEEPIKEEPKRGYFGTILKIATGTAIGRGIGLTMTLVGATVATIPTTVIGLGSIAIGAGMDTVQTRNLRLLKKENSLLTKHRNAKENQDKLLENHPELGKALENKLYTPNRDNQTSLTDRYIKNEPQKTLNITSYGKALVKGSINTIKTVSNAIINPSLINTAKVGNDIRGLYGESKKQATKEEIGLEFKKNIDQERNKSDTPGYNDLMELAQNTREQRVQALALQKLAQDSLLKNLTTAQILEKFELAKQEVLKTEKQIQDTRGLIGTVKSYTKDFIETHNPFSKYNNLDELKPKTRVSPVQSLTPPPQPVSTKTPPEKSKERKPTKETLINLVKQVKVQQQKQSPKHPHPKKKKKTYSKGR